MREEQVLFDAIAKRRTNRQPYAPLAVPEEVLVTLQEAAHAEDGWLAILHKEEDRHALADLVALADLMLWRDPHFRREVIAWTRTHLHRGHHDGIPLEELGFGNLISYVSLRMGRTFHLGNGQAARDRQLIGGSPILAVLGTDVDSEYEWLMAGKALARVLLSARSQGVWASFLNQAIEVSEVRHMLRDLLARGGYPQLLLRMGYATEVSPIPRRGVNEVLLEVKGDVLSDSSVGTPPPPSPT